MQNKININIFHKSSVNVADEDKTWRTIILPVILNGCQTWSLILREEQAQNFRKPVPEETVGTADRKEVTESWKFA